MDTCKFDAALFDKCYHSIFVYRNSAFAKKKNMLPAEQHKTFTTPPTGAILHLHHGIILRFQF